MITKIILTKFKLIKTIKYLPKQQLSQINFLIIYLFKIQGFSIKVKMILTVHSIHLAQ